MEYKSCDWINGGLDFRPDSIYNCCFSWMQNYDESTPIILKKDYHGGKIDWEEVFAIKSKYKNLLKQKITPECCKDCIYLENFNWDEDNKIHCIILNHWSKCDCNCIYCYSAHNKKYYNSRPYYDIVPVLKDMIKNNILEVNDRSFFSFGGGEPAILKNFDKIMDIILKAGFKNIRINSSGIKYSKGIEKGLKNGAASIVISTDSGSKTTYEKIKRVKCFDKVWKNIKKYCKYQKQNNQVKVKYVVIPNINDNKEEVELWLELLTQNNVKALCYSIDKNYTAVPEERLVKNDKTIELYHFLQYIHKRAAEHNFDIEVYSEAAGFMKTMEKHI